MRLARTATLAFLVVLAFLFLFLMWRPAAGHDFYSTACCSGKDCGPVLPGVVTWTPTGWLVAHLHLTVPFNDKRIQYSPPGVPAFHLCMIGSSNMLRCIYIPSPEG